MFTRAQHLFKLNSVLVPSYCFKIPFNIILPSKPRSSYCSLSFSFQQSHARPFGKRLESKRENWESDVNLGNAELRFFNRQLLLRGTNEGVYVRMALCVHGGKREKLTKYCPHPPPPHTHLKAEPSSKFPCRFTCCKNLNGYWSVLKATRFTTSDEWNPWRLNVNPIDHNAFRRIH